MTRHTRSLRSPAPRARGSAPKSIRHRSWNRWLALVACLVVGFHAGAARAQSGPPSVWVPFDSSPAGTPADIVFDPVASSPTSTRFDVFIHGMWRTDREGPGGQVYQWISIPGLQSAFTVGAPELPVYRFDLGIVTGASQATLAEVQVLSEQVIPGILPGPHAIEEAPDTTGTPEQFVLDPAFYTNAAGYPQGPGMAAGAATRFSGTLRAAPGEVYPVHWDPSGNLHVATHASYLYNHAGTPTQAQTPTNMSKTGAMTRLLNAPVVSPWTWVDPVHHAGYFLFIHSTAVSADIDMLIWQKKLRGFGVSVIHTEDLPYGSFFVRSAIENWYAGTPANADHYCLLVGDVNLIPLWNTGTIYPPPVNGRIMTDDIYGDADADGVDDLNEEVHIGRLSYDSGLDLMYQVGRILAYEDQPSPQQPFDRAVLVGWRSDPSEVGVDTRFENIQDQVAAASYSQPVSFTKLYGSNLALNNSWISSFAGQAGIVSYVGHGDWTEWWSWNWFQESYTWWHVDHLNNGPVTPVVWSLSCSTGAIQNSDCMLEHWMSQDEDGAAAAYGATREAYIAGIRVQDAALFRAVFDIGITVHSQAIEYAEAQCTQVDREFNELEFLLLGDPEMHIRRKPVSPNAPWVLTMPLHIPASCPGGCPSMPVDIQVLQGPGGLPAVGVQVSLYKDPGPVNGGAARAAPTLPGAGPTEFQDNRYTDGEGLAHFIVPPLTEGTLYVTVTDDEGNALTQTIPVTGTASVGPRSGAVVRLTAAPSVSSGPVQLSFDRSLERETRIALYDVSGRQVRVLRAPAGAEAIRWDGADESGTPVAAGLYLAGMEGARRNTARIIIVR